MSLMQIHEPGETPLPHANDESVAIGIDLGTTNSVVAISLNGDVQVITDVHGEALLPSVVSYLSSGQILVGQDAQKQLLIDPETVVSSVKRLMGKGLWDVKDLQGILPYDLTDELKAALESLKHKDKQHKGMIKLEVSGRVVSPVEVSAEILKTLKLRAEEALGKPVKKAVITVPAYFDDAARNATKDAARLAGLDVLRLLAEPTAAAVAYGLDDENSKNPPTGIYAVYDLGGGTFDISLLKLQKGVFQVLATGGDTTLGGDDFDHLIADYFLTQSSGTHETSSDAKQLLATARQAKEILTTEKECTVHFGVEGDLKTYSITQETFHDLSKPLVDKTLIACAGAIHDAGLTLSAINGVILVGGATRMPHVKKAVQDFFDKKPLANINPDKVVAAGAARQAEALTKGSDNLLLDVLPLSLGLETMGGLVEKIIDRNTPIPVSKSQEFTTYQDNQTAMLIHVLQGERETVEHNRSLAQFTLKGIPARVAGSARIQVTFTVDADGILTVTAFEKQTGTSAHVEVKPSYGLTEDEMANMLMASMQNASEDMEKRLLIQQRVEGRQILNMLAVAISEDGDLMERATREEVDVLHFDLEKLINGDDRDAIRITLEKLDKLVQPFAEARVNRAFSKTLKGKKVDTL